MEDAYAPWAWKKGYTDNKFNPVEYVKDDVSINRYGPLLDGLDNNEEIYPTIQGVRSADHPTFFKEDIGRIDQVVAVEEVLSDDVAASTDSESQLYDLQGGAVWSQYVLAGETVSLSIVTRVPFSVETGRKVNLEARNVNLQGVIDYIDGTRGDFSEFAQLVSVDFRVYTRNAPVLTVPAVGIPAGDYYYDLTVKVKNNYNEPISIIATVPGVVATSAAVSEARWRNTFNIWIKNIWATSKESGESDGQYAGRVWGPILGDHLGNDAKVVFSSGMLSTSEDYEFVITKMPELDTTKSFATKEDGIGFVYQSYWKLLLSGKTLT